MNDSDKIANTRNQIDDAERQIKLNQDTTRMTQQLSAWGVGIAAPGMLGLLSNAPELYLSSRFTAVTFNALFILAEAFFLTSVVLAILLHHLAVQTITLSNFNLQTIFRQGTIGLAAMYAGRLMTSEENNEFDELSKRRPAVDRAITLHVARVSSLCRVQLVLLFCAYVPVTVVLISLSFGHR